MVGKPPRKNVTGLWKKPDIDADGRQGTPDSETTISPSPYVTEPRFPAIRPEPVVVESLTPEQAIRVKALVRWARQPQQQRREDQHAGDIAQPPCERDHRPELGSNQPQREQRQPEQQEQEAFHESEWCEEMGGVAGREPGQR